jgi:F420-0:gamma-glutamyl ligase
VTETTLLAALEGIVDYAESEAFSLESLKDRPEAEEEAERAWKAVETAQAVIAEARAAYATTEAGGILLLL